MWKWFVAAVLCVLVIGVLVVRSVTRADHDRAMQDIDAERKALRR